MILAMGCLSLEAVELDTPAVGRDLNGWQEGDVAWFGTDGLTFRASMPTTRSLENGAVEIVMKVEEIAKKTSVYTANVRVVASQDGLVLAASVEGRVDGADFKSGEVTLPEAAVVAEAEEAAEGEAVEVTPGDAEREMTIELSQSLDSAIERVRTGGKQVKRDVASRFFGAKAGDSASLTKATELVVKSLFSRVGR